MFPSISLSELYGSNRWEGVSMGFSSHRAVQTSLGDKSVRRKASRTRSPGYNHLQKKSLSKHLCSFKVPLHQTLIKLNRF